MVTNWSFFGSNGVNPETDYVFNVLICIYNFILFAEKIRHCIISLVDRSIPRS